MAIAGRLGRRGGSSDFSIKKALVVGQLWGLGLGNRGVRRRPLLGLAPQLAVLEELLYHVRLAVAVDQRQDLHRAPTVGALERVDFIHHLYQRRPRQPEQQLLSRQCLCGLGGKCSLQRFFAYAAGLIGVPAVVPYLVLSLIGDLLGHLGQKVQWLRYTHYVPGDSPALKRFVTRLATGYANLCDRVIAPSHGVQEMLHERGVKRPTTVIPSGIDIEAFADGDSGRFRKRFGIPEDAFLIGTVSRLAPEKNVPFLAEAATRFCAGGDNRYFAAVGSGPSEKQIDEAAHAAGVEESVIRTGTLENQELVDAYHAFDLFIFASLTETQGMVLTEAMAAGTPVVSLSATGADDIVDHERNGLLQHDGTPAELAHLMEHYFSLPPDTRRQYVDEARETAKSYDQSACAEKTLALYEEAIDQGRGQHALEESPWDLARRRIRTELHLLGNFASATASAIESKE